MKQIKSVKKAARLGFTLIEMIGVLAIIAVLAGLLLPRIFEAMNDARINSDAMGYNSVKSAAMGYFGKYGRFGDAAGTAYTPAPVTATDWGAVLLTTGLIEKPFSSKIGGNNSLVEIISATPDNVTGANSAYSMDGASVTNSTVGASIVVQVHLTGVDLSDARALSMRLDGELLSNTNIAGGTDLKGKVKYDFGADSTGEVYLYVIHK